MQEYCHRCGGELSAERGETPFCPHCGAPQLTLALEQQSVEAGGVPDGGVMASTGAVPPPMPRGVDWRVAIRYAAGVAVVGSVLSLAAAKVDVLSLPSLLWIVSGSMITLGLYQRRLPAARIDAGIGARIGVVVGLCLALGLAASMAGWGLVERYALHGMGSFDASVAAHIQQSQQQAWQWMAAQSIPVTPEVKAFEQTAEFRAGLVLFYGVIGAGFLLVVSMVGGAFGGLLRMRRR